MMPERDEPTPAASATGIGESISQRFHVTVDFDVDLAQYDEPERMARVLVDYFNGLNDGLGIGDNVRVACHVAD